MTTQHQARIEIKDGYASIKINCPGGDLQCRARFSCECESYHCYEVIDGRPTHTNYDDEIHIGEFGSTCNYADWIEHDEPEVMNGTVIVTVPAEISWEGDYYTWYPKGDARAEVAS